MNNDKPLSRTNPYLKDKKSYEESLFINVSSSACVELGNIPPALIKALRSKYPLTLIYLSPEIEKEFGQ